MESVLPITALFAAILGLVFVPLSARVGFYRLKSQISLFDGGDKELARRMRAQGNFAEYVPIALILLALVELNGALDWVVYLLGGSLVVGRLLHLYTISGSETGPGRPIGMVLTFLSILGSSGLLLYGHFMG